MEKDELYEPYPLIEFSEALLMYRSYSGIARAVGLSRQYINAHAQMSLHLPESVSRRLRDSHAWRKAAEAGIVFDELIPINEGPL